MDVVANMLTSLVNAQKVGKKRVALPYSNFRKQLLDFFVVKGLVANVRVQESVQSKLIVTLAYDENDKPVISGAKRMSSPGRRYYAKTGEIPYAYQGYGTIIISTPGGLMNEVSARKKGVGGELVCAIW